MESNMTLGLKVLEEVNISVKARYLFGGRSLNNTFTVLNRFALIDRNEQDQNVQSSQSSQRSREMLADNIDVIRLHGVVQAFFADSLYSDKKPGMYFEWLAIAVRLFCCSYDTAADRIARKTNTGLVEDYRLYEIHGIRLREHCAKHERKNPMPEILRMLVARLASIKQEIDRRTPESSNFIAGGGGNAPQTSIFDRTSSSSDTNPDTPGDGESDKVVMSTAPTWILPRDQEHHSPVDIIHHNFVPNQSFRPYGLDSHEDDGYDTDLDDTVQLSPLTTKTPGSPNSPGGPWSTVPLRKKPRITRPELVDHRTTRNRENHRYSDRAGSFRAVNAVDPRNSRQGRPAGAEVTRTIVRGFVQRASSRDPSRGRMSGQSNAKAALAHISANSPPSPKAEDAVHEHRSLSQRAKELGRLRTGAASYAAAVSGFARDVVLAATESPVSPREREVALSPSPPQSIAVLSLKQLPSSPIQQPADQQMQFTLMPPYPPTPGFDYVVNHPSSDTNLHQLSEQYNQENRDPSSNLYPRLTGAVPRENNDTSVARKQRDSGRGYTGNESLNNAESLDSSMHAVQNPPFLSLSSPNIRMGENTYHPGYPEFSSHTQIEGRDLGYSSQPMSRDPSGQSARSDHSRHSAQDPYSEDWSSRRPSVAETEPPPMLPDFSPRIPPTSYEVYERTRDVRQERVTSRRGSRLEVSRLRERLEEWTVVSGPEEE
jgi:hypothetical protein